MSQNSAGVSSLSRARLFGRLFLISLMSLAVSCSGNFLTELSDQISDAALLEGAKRSMASGDYASAVTKCTELSTAFQGDADAVYTCASAYSGRAGMNMISLVSDLSAYASPTYFLEYMMTKNNGAVDQDITDLAAAMTLLRSIGTTAQRTDEQNALITLISIHSLGVVANLYADTDDDGGVDVGYDSCTADVAAVGADLALNALWEIQASAGASGIPGGSDVATAITAACTALNGVSATLDFCADSNPTTFDANDLRGAQTLFAENTLNFGLQDCVNPGCVCP